MGTEFPDSIRVDEPRLETQAQNKRGLLSVLLSSRGLLVFVMMLLIFFTGAAQPITDPDFWWHLKTGQYIVETKSIPYTDIFSNLRFGSEWITHEWLSEVFIYSVLRTLGYGGLIAIFSILITGSFWIVYQRCRKRGVHPYVAGFALLLGAASTMPTWGVRPQMFSLLFGSVFISFLNRYSRREAIPSIWWLAPLMVLWVNMHAGFALGLVLIVLTIAGLLLDWLLLRKDSLAVVWRRVLPPGALMIVCVAVVCLNPNGARLYSYPFETLSSQAMMQYLHEWKSPNFQVPMFQALALLILGTLGVRHSLAKQPISEAQRFPKAAVDFILAQKPPQPIYNEYIWGGYLIWRLYPDY